MRTRILTGFMVMTISGWIAATSAIAQEKPVLLAQAGMYDQGTSMDGQMNEHLDMSKIQGMMKNCMSKNSDSKMCDKEAMQSCQKNMNMSECQKMLKAAKKIK